MLRLDQGSQFKKDWKRVVKSGRFDPARFKHVVNMLAHELPLERRHRDHVLSGEWGECRECHVSPDLLLIYLKTSDAMVLVRIGSHSELFD